MKNRLQKLSLLNTLAISFTAIAPTCAMAMNTTVVSRYAGKFMPLSFVFGGIALLFVGVCFSIMAAQTSGIGSVYAYNKMALGEGTGFMTGWLLMLVYLAGGAGALAMSTNFLQVLLNALGLHLNVILIAMVLLLILYLVNLLGLRTTSEISLLVEFIAVIILALICGTILTHGGANGLSLAPFHPTSQDLPGIGRGIIYVIICFAGFEEATTMTIRTQNPRKIIPITIMSTIGIVAMLYVIVSYTQIMGYGVWHVAALSHTSAPLNYLATRYCGHLMAILIDLAVTISSIASFMGIMNAGSYMVFAMGRKHYLPEMFSRFNHYLAVPLTALTSVMFLYAVEYLSISLMASNQMTFATYMGIAGLSFLLVYLLVCVGVIAFVARNYKTLHHTIIKGIIIPLLGIVTLSFPLVSTIFPVPAFPANLYPYLIAGYLLVGWGVYRLSGRLQK